MSTVTIGFASILAGVLCLFASKEPANSSPGYKVSFKQDKKGWRLGNMLMGKFLTAGGAVYLAVSCVLNRFNIGNEDVIQLFDILFRIYIIASMIIIEIYTLRAKKKHSK